MNPMVLPEFEDVFPVAVAPVTFSARQKIYYPQSGGLYYVHSGFVRVVRLCAEGVQRHVDFYKAGHVFGESSLEPQQPQEMAIACTAARVGCWKTKDVDILLRDRPGSGAALLRLLSSRAERYLTRSDNATQCQLINRIKFTVLDIAERIGTPQSDGSTLIDFHISHELISSMVGSSREIVTFHLNTLRQAGFLHYHTYRRTGMRVFENSLKAAAVAA